MIINKTYKFRLYPTSEQEQMLLQQTGNSRFVWNKLVEFNKKYKEEYDKFPTQLILQKQIIELKKEFEFTKLTHSQPLQINAKRIVKVVTKAFKPEAIQARKQKIAKTIAEKTKKEKKYPNYNHKKAMAKAFNYGFPHFKRKANMRGSLFYPQNFKIKRSRIFFAKLGWIHYIKHREIEGNPKNVTITQDGNQWYVSICCEVKIKETVKPSIDNANIIGIDVGIKEFATFSDSTVIHNPRILKKYSKKLKKEQKKLSKREFIEKEIKEEIKKVSSNNRNKQRTKVQNIHRKIRNIRKDFLHKITHDIITKYDGVTLETLNIKDMLQKNDKSQNRNTCDISWYEFSRMLEYKCLWNSKYFHKIDEYFASTKTCSECGNKQEMLLEERTYLCKACGNKLDRDYNASINIKREGISCLKKANYTTVGTMGSYACGQSPLGDWLKQEKREKIQAIA